MRAIVEKRNGWNNSPAGKETDLIAFSDCYEIKDYLKARGYKWNGIYRQWERPYTNLTDELIDVVVDNRINPEIAANCIQYAFERGFAVADPSAEKDAKLAAYMAELA